MAELADALDLGSNGNTVQVRSLLPAPTKMTSPYGDVIFVCTTLAEEPAVIAKRSREAASMSSGF